MRRDFEIYKFFLQLAYVLTHRSVIYGRISDARFQIVLSLEMHLCQKISEILIEFSRC